MTTKTARSQSFTNYKKGLIFEEKARIFLQKKGYKVIAKRYKNQFGEIDIIAESFDVRDNVLKNGFNFKSYKKCLVFFEVKSRKRDDLIEVIIRKSQVERIKNCASIFLSQNSQYDNYDIRFDFILFSGSRCPRHYINYF